MVHKKDRRSRESGFVAVAYAGMMLGLLGFTGMAVDVGYLQYERRWLQTAADAAAMGALREMELGNTDLTAAGQNDSSLNGMTDGKNSTTVTVSNPPTSGHYAGDTSAIQATVQKAIPTFFMMVFGQKSVTLSATAVARTTTKEGSVGGCIFALDPTAGDALKVDGTVNMSTACGAMVNSNSSSAFDMVGNSTFNLASGAQVGVVGPGTAGQGWTMGGGAQLINTATNKTENPVNIQTFADPLAKVVAPTFGTLANQTIYNSTMINPNQNVALTPGVYCGGINVKGTASFAAGTYVLAGGGLTINSQATVTGSGVMFYNTNGSFSGSCGNSSAGSFTFNGGASINLQGMTVTDGAGTVGVLFFDDRNVSGLNHTINGNSTSTFDGALYFPNSYLKFAGTNKTPGFLYIVADTIEFTGTANLGNDHTDLANVYTLAPTSTGGGLVQ